MLEGNLFKIKEGKLDAWKGWCHELATTLRAEAIETLKEEHCQQEAFLLFEIGGVFTPQVLARENACLRTR